MDQLERDVARQRAQRKLAAMNRRAGQLRRRVVATAIVGFAMLWTAVFVQMATGNDPVLGTGGAPATRESAAPAPKRRDLEAAVPPPGQADQLQAERLQAERWEAEQREAEIRELEELEAVTTGQS
jgi:hypothetical protein